MVIRQEETTPIGDCFHDSGIVKTFERIRGIVDEFEVDTERLQALCDNAIYCLKKIKEVTKTAEACYRKKKAQEELMG